ncbi:MAG: hypothetical protein AAF525_00695 [Pseudomonadota bacterium]
MSWLLRLYPTTWQQRYRHEMEAHLADEPRTLRRDLDLLAGAVDAHLNPDFTPEPTLDHGDSDMTSFFRCCSSDMTITDGFKSAATIIGVTFVLTAIGVALDKTLGNHIAIQALMLSSWMIAMAIASPFSYLKPYSKTAQYVMVSAAIPASYFFFLATLYVGSVF